jgi:hypothetical protein
VESGSELSLQPIAALMHPSEIKTAERAFMATSLEKLKVIDATALWRRQF